MNKRKIVAYLLLLSAILIVSVGSMLAWFTSGTKTTEINGETTGISFTYKVGNVDGTNSFDYSIENLTFFDVDSEAEARYFNDQVTIVNITLRNMSVVQVNYNVAQEGLNIPESIEGLSSVETAYVKCLFSTSPISNPTNTIAELYDANESANGTLAAGASVSIYVYIFGVQINDAAVNDFLDEVYDFKISLTVSS